MRRVPPPCLRRKQLGRYIRFASRAVRPLRSLTCRTYVHAINRAGYPVETRDEYDMDMFTLEKPDVSGFWIYHIVSISSGIYWDIGYISDMFEIFLGISLYIGYIT